MSKKIYMDGPIFDFPRIPENEDLFKSVVNEEEEEKLKKQEGSRNKENG